MKLVASIVAEASVELGIISAASIGLVMSEVTVPEGAAAGGIAGIVVVIGGAVVNWYLRVRKESFENKTARVEVEQATEDKQAARDRKARRDALEEWQQTVADLRTDRDLDRKEIHDLRDAFQAEKMEHQAEKIEHAATRARLDACEKDRAELFRRVEALEKK